MYDFGVEVFDSMESDRGHTVQVGRPTYTSHPSLLTLKSTGCTGTWVLQHHVSLTGRSKACANSLSNGNKSMKPEKPHESSGCQNIPELSKERGQT